jgi:mRNA interferase MazF
MGCSRGEVRLASFSPSKGTEAGKIRACLILQSDLLNEAGHPSATVIPLTSRVLDETAPLRFRIGRRDNLQEDSDVMIDQVRTIDNRRFTGEALTRLTSAEIAEIEEYLKIVLGMSVG